MEQDKITGEKKPRSPEKLNEYIRIGSAGGNLLIAGLIILAVALIVWGFAGRIPVTSTLRGVILDDTDGFRTCLCLVDVNGKTGFVPEGAPAIVRTIDGKTHDANVSMMGVIALSEEELQKTFSDENPLGYDLSDWILDSLKTGSKYYYPLYMKTEEDLPDYWYQITEVTITHSEVRPISFLLAN